MKARCNSSSKKAAQVIRLERLFLLNECKAEAQASRSPKRCRLAGVAIRPKKSTPGLAKQETAPFFRVSRNSKNSPFFCAATCCNHAPAWTGKAGKPGISRPDFYSLGKLGKFAFFCVATCCNLAYAWPGRAGKALQFFVAENPASSSASLSSKSTSSTALTAWPMMATAAETSTDAFPQVRLRRKQSTASVVTV